MRYKLMSRAIVLALVIFGMLAASCGQGAGASRIGVGCQPSWSPDGSKILFVDQGGIYMTDPDGGHRTPVLPIAGDAQFEIGTSAWSPDGKRIVYAAMACIFTFTLGEDGSNVTKVTGEPGPIHWTFAPSWSPDGKRIVFESHEDTGDSDDYPVFSTSKIVVVDIDGSNERTLTAEDDHWPAWSPDGSKIAFESRRDGNYEIYVMNADGSNPTRLTENTAITDGYPVWSPDGTKIAFISNRDGQRDIYIMNADGSKVTRLTENSFNESSLSWSPDGTKIAFCGYYSDEPEPETYIYLVNAPS